jgi:hypothetical protein
MEIKDISGKFEIIDYNFFGIKKKVEIASLYYFKVETSTPVNIYITLSVVNANKEVCCNIKTKSTNYIINDKNKELTSNEVLFIIKNICVPNTIGTLKNKLFEELKEDVILLPPIDKEYDNLETVDETKLN